ncbi:hypothetical protein C2S52_006318 [Perilla frutescens var. hirtella]|nr:hypothetical protein C2S52_006318 [Perilla frutescens var. hirtella]
MAAATVATWKGELHPPPTAAAAAAVPTRRRRRRGPCGCECCTEFHHDYERKISRRTIPPSFHWGHITTASPSSTTDATLARIEDIRHFYGGLLRDEYDEALAEMMPRDACVVLYCVEMNAAKEEDEENGEEKVMFLFRRLGMFQASLMAADVYKLENQIPWWLINSLIRSAYDGDKKEEGEALMFRFLSFQTLGNFTKLKQLPWYLVRDEYFPLHLLEAIRITSLVNPEDPEINNLLDFDRYAEEMAIIVYFILLLWSASPTCCCNPQRCRSHFLQHDGDVMKSMIEEIVRIFKEIDSYGIETLPVSDENQRPLEQQSQDMDFRAHHHQFSQPMDCYSSPSRRLSALPHFSPNLIHVESKKHIATLTH